MLSLIADNMLICVVYRPRGGNILNCFTLFESLLGFGSANNFNVIISGDFNINMLVDSTP